MSIAPVADEDDKERVVTMREPVEPEPPATDLSTTIDEDDVLAPPLRAGDVYSTPDEDKTPVGTSPTRPVSILPESLSPSVSDDTTGPIEVVSTDAASRTDPHIEGPDVWGTGDSVESLTIRPTAEELAGDLGMTWSDSQETPVAPVGSWDADGVRTAGGEESAPLAQEPSGWVWTGENVAEPKTPAAPVDAPPVDLPAPPVKGLAALPKTPMPLMKTPVPSASGWQWTDESSDFSSEQASGLLDAVAVTEIDQAIENFDEIRRIYEENIKRRRAGLPMEQGPEPRLDAPPPPLSDQAMAGLAAPAAKTEAAESPFPSSPPAPVRRAPARPESKLAHLQDGGPAPPGDFLPPAPAPEISDLEPSPEGADKDPLDPRFGKYLLLGRVGVGGMAEVQLAVEVGANGFQKACVIKRIAPEHRDDVDYERLFREEGKICMRLNHPHIVGFHEFDEIDGSPYLAMELVDGVDVARLDEMCGKKGLPLPVILEIGFRIANALDYAHGFRDAQGQPMHVVHRDVSPQNILISREGAVKLADFGIARFEGRGFQTGVGPPKGKLGYVAPEQLDLQTAVDGRADLFALGVVLTELVSGRVPLPEGPLVCDDLERAVRESLKGGRIEAPPPLEELLVKMLSNDQDARPSASEVGNTLRTVAMELADKTSVTEFMVEQMTTEVPRAEEVISRLLEDLGIEPTLATDPREQLWPSESLGWLNPSDEFRSVAYPTAALVAKLGASAREQAKARAELAKSKLADKLPAFPDSFGPARTKRRNADTERDEEDSGAAAIAPMDVGPADDAPAARRMGWIMPVLVVLVAACLAVAVLAYLGLVP